MGYLCIEIGVLKRPSLRVNVREQHSNRIEVSGVAAKELVHFNFLIKLSALNTFCLLFGASSGKALTRTHTHPAKLRNNNDNNTIRLVNTECGMGDVDGAITSVLESSSSSAYGAHTASNSSKFTPVCARCEILEKKIKLKPKPKSFCLLFVRHRLAWWRTAYSSFFLCLKLSFSFRWLHSRLTCFTFCARFSLIFWLRSARQKAVLSFFLTESSEILWSQHRLFAFVFSSLSLLVNFNRFKAERKK